MPPVVAVGLQSNQQSIVFASPSKNTLFSAITVRLNFLLTGAALRDRGKPAGTPALCMAWCTHAPRLIVGVLPSPNPHGASSPVTL
jgi:hypothetical protein